MGYTASVGWSSACSRFLRDFSKKFPQKRPTSHPSTKGMLEKTKKKKNRNTRKEKPDEFPCNNQLSARSAAASSDALGLRVSLAGDPSGRSALMSILSFQQQQQNQGTPSSSFPAAANPRATGITYRYGQRQVKRRARPRPAAGNRSLSCRRSSSRAFGTHVGARSAGSGRPNKRISHTGRQAPPRAAPRRPSPRLACLASCDDTIQPDLARARHQARETASPSAPRKSIAVHTGRSTHFEASPTK